MLEAICQNCSFFFSDNGSSDWDHGVCMYDSTEFEPYIDDILEDSDFSTCAELYKLRRISGETKACDNYEQLEYVELDEDDFPDEESIEELIESWKTADLSDVGKDLYSTDTRTAKEALSTIINYMQLGNKTALKAFYDYYMDLGAPDTLDEVHKRINYVDLLSQRADKEMALEAYINDLKRTPSNNMTRGLFTAIFRKLAHFPSGLIREPLLVLIEEKNFSYRLKKRIHEVIEEAEYIDRSYW